MAEETGGAQPRPSRFRKEDGTFHEWFIRGLWGAAPIIVAAFLFGAWTWCADTLEVLHHAKADHPIVEANSIEIKAIAAEQKRTNALLIDRIIPLLERRVSGVPDYPILGSTLGGPNSEHYGSNPDIAIDE